MKKLKEVFKANAPFVNEENKRINMITKAVMSVTVKEVVVERDQIGQDHFNNFVKDRIVEQANEESKPSHLADHMRETEE